MTYSNIPSRRGTVQPVFLVVLATIIFGLSIFIKPCASLLLLQSFPNSSLWRDRYLGSDRQRQQQQQQQQQQQDYYDILGVRRNVNKDDIKIAFRQLVKLYHPDANPNTDTTDEFQTINQAYQTLSDPQKRRRYNTQMYPHGFSSDTPNFIIDALENDYEPQESKTTDAVRYHRHQWEPNNNGRGSLLKNDDDEDENGTNGGYRIRSY